MINSGVEILQAAKRPRTRSVTFRLRSSDRWSSAPSSTSWSRSARWNGDAALYRNVASTSAAHGLADLAEDVEAVLVIVGTAQETGLTRALLGSSTERLLHGATVPVTVVPPGWRKSAPDQISRIGVASSTPGTPARRCGWRYGSPCESRPG